MTDLPTGYAQRIVVRMPSPLVCILLLASSMLFITGCQPSSEKPAPIQSEQLVVPPMATQTSADTLIWQGPWIRQMQAEYQANPAGLTSEMEVLLRYADADLNRQPQTVVSKTILPASDNPHDYYSLGPYWWPNPDSEDGLPYIRRDGEWNKDNVQDMNSLGNVMNAVRRLGLAYYLTQDERYARHATLWLRAFFLDESTRMNPHLRYAQAIPGECDGRHIGMIDTWSLPTMLDAVTLLQGSGSWTSQDEAAFRQWVDELLDWFLTSDYADEESTQANNHSVWYYAQIGAYAVYAGRVEEMRQIYTQKVPALTEQIAPDGRLPQELARTRPLHYSCFCLQAFLDVLAVCDKIDLEFPEQQTRVHQAVVYLGYYMDHPEEWPYSEMRDHDARDLWTVFRRAAKRFDDPRCIRWEQEAPAPKEKDTYLRLVYAPLEPGTDNSD